MRYELIFYWSKEDQSFLVEVPELAGGRGKGGARSKKCRVSIADFNIALCRETEGRDLDRPIVIDGSQTLCFRI
jgi:hypothetical protein